jgi:hypothetical protein
MTPRRDAGASRALAVPDGRPAVRPSREPDHQPGDEPIRGRVVPTERIALVDLLDRVLAGGVVVTGDITLSIADVDLVRVSLRALVSSISALTESGADAKDTGR